MVGDMAATAATSLAQSTSLWSTVSEWFTPTVFFVLLNVVIGTIAVTSKTLSSHHAHSGSGAKPGADHQQQQQHYGTEAGADQFQYHDAAAAPPPARQLSRTGSMLQRLKSFNLGFHMYRYRPEDYGLVAAGVPEPPAAAAHAGGVVEAVLKEPQHAAQKPAKAAQKPRRRDPSPPRHQIPQEHPHHQRHHHLPDEEPEFASDAAEFETLEEAFLAASGGSSTTHLNRIQSDTLPTAGEIPRKLAATMKKSASTKSAFSHFEPSDLPRRPATTRDDRRRDLLDPAAAADDDDDAEAFADAAAAICTEVAGSAAPHVEVDARADDFINRFREQLKLQRLESLMRYRDMLNRGR